MADQQRFTKLTLHQRLVGLDTPFRADQEPAGDRRRRMQRVMLDMSPEQKKAEIKRLRERIAARKK